MTVYSYGSTEQRDLQPVSKVTAVAVPLWSCDCNLGSWQPIYTYDRLPRALKSHELQSSLPSPQKINGEADREGHNCYHLLRIFLLVSGGWLITPCAKTQAGFSAMEDFQSQSGEDSEAFWLWAWKFKWLWAACAPSLTLLHNLAYPPWLMLERGCLAQWPGHLFNSRTAWIAVSEAVTLYNCIAWRQQSQTQLSL